MGKIPLRVRAMKGLRHAAFYSPKAALVVAIDGVKKTPLVAQRLRLLQEMFEGTGRGASLRMAQRLGITPHHWYNVVTASPLSITLAQQIVRTFPGVSLDWLYLGRPEGLSRQMAEKLGYGGARPSDAEEKTNQEQTRPLTI